MEDVAIECPACRLILAKWKGAPRRPENPGFSQQAARGEPGFSLASLPSSVLFVTLLAVIATATLELTLPATLLLGFGLLLPLGGFMFGWLLLPALPVWGFYRKRHPAKGLPIGEGVPAFVARLVLAYLVVEACLGLFLVHQMVGSWGWHQGTSLPSFGDALKQEWVFLPQWLLILIMAMEVFGVRRFIVGPPPILVGVIVALCSSLYVNGEIHRRRQAAINAAAEPERQRRRLEVEERDKLTQAKAARQHSEFVRRNEEAEAQRLAAIAEAHERTRAAEATALQAQADTLLLFDAAGRGDRGLVDKLMAAGAYRVMKCQRHDHIPDVMKPLGCAVEARDSRAVRTLIHARIDVDELQGGGQMSPLGLAAEEGATDIMRDLVAAGAKIDIRQGQQSNGMNNGTPLFRACLGGRLDAVDLLIRAGADVNARGFYGSTPLMAVGFPSSTPDPAVVRALLEAGADVAAQNSRGQTARSIMSAKPPSKEREEILQLLAR